MQPARGMHDLLPQVYKVHKYIVDTALDVSRCYGYQSMATPLVENIDLFCRTLGDVSDIVSKEMYDLVQKGSERLVLRPEGTAGVARAIISNGLTQSLPQRLISSGPMFRYERPQKGRTRQFHQVSAELFGVADPIGDLELITMAHDFLKALGLETRVKLEINTLGDGESRAAYRSALVEYFTQHKDELSDDSLTRLDKNPLRILDSKDPKDKEIVAKAPVLGDYLNQESQDKFNFILKGLDRLRIPYVLNPYLVRGLDYYCHAAFEFTTEELGAQSAVIAGGRYDTLVSTLGGPDIPGVGWACGIERLALMVEMPQTQDRPIAMIAGDEECELIALELSHGLRSAGFWVEPIMGGNFGKKLKKATKLQSQYALLLGSDECQQKTVTVKDLDEGSQESVPFDQVVSHFQKVAS